MLAELPVSELQGVLEPMLANGAPRGSIRNALQSFAEKHDIPL